MRRRKTEIQWLIQKRRELLSPAPFAELADIEKEIEHRPRYVGPGPWISAVEHTSTDQKER